MRGALAVRVLAGGAAGWNATWPATATRAATAAATGSDPLKPARRGAHKPPESGGFFVSAGGRRHGENCGCIAGHRGGALLNDAPLATGPSGCRSGRIAQLVEQLTLNQRVPGSSPGAPTKQSQILSWDFARTKRVSCDVFCGRTSHAVRRVDDIL